MKKISQQRRIDAISLLQKRIFGEENCNQTWDWKIYCCKNSKRSKFELFLNQKWKPRLLNARQESFIVHQIYSGKVNDASQARKHLNNDFRLEVSTQTVRNMLKKR